MTTPQQNGSLPLLVICTSVSTLPCSRTFRPALSCDDLQYPQADVRQSVFALVGDIASRAVDALYPILDQLVPILIEKVNPRPKLSQVSAESNCVWCLGELCMALGKLPSYTHHRQGSGLIFESAGNNMDPFVETLLQRLLPILSSIKASPNLLENTAITMGRLALASPQKVAPHLGDIIRIWSQTMMHVSSGAEQDSALRGMCEAAKCNPVGVREGGQVLLEALARSTNPSDELRAVSSSVSRATYFL